MEKLQDRFIKKSIEAFILGLELYNKPTIKYRIEGFSFFICNAWELMLKAKLLNDDSSIYYDDNNDRTLSISDIIKKIYTDKRQPLRINLEKVVDLRNTSTHFVTEDYETVYAPLFQATVFNYCEQLHRFHNVDITEHIAQNFLTLSVNIQELNHEEIRGKYPPEMAEKLITKKDDIEYEINQSNSNALFIPIKHEIALTKDKDSAKLLVAIDKGSDSSVRIVKDYGDPNNKYHLSFNNIINAINQQITSKGLQLNYTTSSGENKFNSYTLDLLIKFYNIKSDKKYSYHFAENYRYSQQLVDFIVQEIKKDPDIIENIKKIIKKR